ncbi:MAG: hypothetical protein P1V51_08580 [Deltaproteobacteria bacterium]|nr:hypothetical protein [Deltaproteobacteria bacterium]
MRATTILTLTMTLSLGGAMGCNLLDDTAPEELAELVPPSSAEAGASALDLDPPVRLVADLSARMELDLAADPEGALETLVDQLATSTWTTRLFASEQLTYLVPQLAEMDWRLDLAATSSELTSFEVSPAGVLSLAYDAHLVVLAPPGTAVPAEPVALVLPTNPWRLQARAGHRCLAEGHRDAPAERYAFHFDPGREGCEEAMISIGVRGEELRLGFVAAEQPAPLWPEYDRMAEDGRVEAVVVAGAISPSWEPGLADPSKRDLKAMTETLELVGFVRLPAAEGSQVVTLERRIELDPKLETYFEEQVTLIGPEALAAGEEREGEILERLARAEILLLASEDAADAVISALSAAEQAPGYQVFVLDGSWRYHDQAVEIFSSRATPEDPTGGADLDVLANVAPAAVVGKGERMQLFVLNLFKGAMEGGVEGERFYSWDRIVATANLRARESTGQASDSHALFGTTGLEGNRFVPAAE